jgi:hypothetical protein
MLDDGVPGSGDIRPVITATPGGEQAAVTQTLGQIA